MSVFLLNLLLFLLFLTAPFFIPMIIFYLYYLIIGMRIKKGTYKYVAHGSKLKRLFLDFPRRFVLDRMERDPDMFRDYGVHLICGEQGSGKSITLTYLLMRYQKMYPKLCVKTNYGYAHEVGCIQHWEDLVASNNGIYGEIDVLDEIQNWFNSNQSRNFPPEMLTEITQQRKQKKCIFGTAQVFSRVAKPIREQVSFLYKPFTLFGCLTFVRVYKPYLSSDDGQVGKEKLRNFFFFVHSPTIRESFDTYRKVESLLQSGFRPVNEQYRNQHIILDTAEKES